MYELQEYTNLQKSSFVEIEDGMSHEIPQIVESEQNLIENGGIESKISRKSQFFIKISIICMNIFVCILIYLSRFQSSSMFSSSSINTPLSTSSGTVLIYTSTSFHQEVASSLCCTFHRLGYTVYSFITPSADLTSIQEFYGHCVDKWALIGQDDQYRRMPTPDLVLFTTYPLHYYDEQDHFAQMIITDILHKNSITKFGGVMHHATILKKHPLPSFIPSHRFTSIYLSEHTLNSSFASNHTNNLFNNSIYLYPIPPLNIIPKHLRSPLPESLNESFPSIPHESSSEVVVQGHFGGQHSWRRNHHRLLDCLQDYQGQKNITSKHSLSVHFIGKGELDFTSKELKSLNIQHSADLKSFKLFYHAISHGTYLALTQLDDEYYSYRATSSIPAALLTGVPLIMDIKLLQLYPCLRDSYYHLFITKMSFCESLTTALTLTRSERDQLINEIFMCRQQYQHDAEIKLMNLMPRDDANEARG